MMELNIFQKQGPLKPSYDYYDDFIGQMICRANFKTGCN